MSEHRGCPVALSVFEGNTSDSTTFLPQVNMLFDQFGIRAMVMVGDRGIISNKPIAEMQQAADVDWMTALKTASIRSLVEQKYLQLDLFDERNLLEFTSPDFPGERLVACRNLELAKRREYTQEALLQATEVELEIIKLRTTNGELVGQDQFGLAVGKIFNWVFWFIVTALSDIVTDF